MNTQVKITITWTDGATTVYLRTALEVSGMAQAFIERGKDQVKTLLVEML